MRVGFNLLYLRPGRVGGSEVYARSLLSAMASQLDEPVTVFVSGEAAATFAESPKIRVVPVFDGPFSQAKRLLAENLLLARVLRAHPVDVVLSPANFSPVLLPSGVPQVASVCDLQHLGCPDNFSWRTRLAREAMFRATFLRCRHLLAISEFTRDEVVAHYGVPASRITPTQLGADLPQRPTPAAVEEVRGRHVLGAEYVIYPAMMAPHKNHRSLFQAWAELRHRHGRAVPLVLTGAHSQEFARFAPLLRELRIEDLVRSLGLLPRADFLALLSGASAMVFPSRFEGFGMPLIEAMALGVPVVSSRAASLTEVAGDAALLLAPEDVAGWADAVLRVLSDPPLRARLVAAGAENVKRFSWERCAAETLAALRGVAGRAAARAA